MNEDSRAESPCSPNGFGYCDTHPTCEHVRHAKEELHAQITRWQKDYATNEAERSHLANVVVPELRLSRDRERSINEQQDGLMVFRQNEIERLTAEIERLRSAIHGPNG